jgi:predicted transposase YdaD
MYNQELQKIEPAEREVIMHLTNEWIEQGRTEGRTEGRSQGRREVILRQLRRRVGGLPPEMEEQISRLPEARLDDFAEALLDFCELEDVRLWLAKPS